MTAVSRRTALLRGLRCRCPACGRGRVFVRRFETAAACTACGFSFERGDGHWIGGNEINLIVTYPVACVALAVPAFAWGASWMTAALGGLFAAALGVALHRPSRGLFFAIDYLVEPDWSPDDDEQDDEHDRGSGDDDPGDPDAPPGGPRGRRAPDVVVLPVPLPSPRDDAETDPAPQPPTIVA